MTLTLKIVATNLNHSSIGLTLMHGNIITATPTRPQLNQPDKITWSLRV